MGPARGRIGAGRRDGTSHAVRRRRYRTRCADSVSRFPLLVSPPPRRLRLASRLARAPFDCLVGTVKDGTWCVLVPRLAWRAGSPPQTRKLTSLVPCSSWRLFTCPVFARDALRLRPTPQSSATSVRAAESSARTRTTVSRRPSSVRSTLPSATATSVAWSRRSSTTLAGESLLSCRRAGRVTAIARRGNLEGHGHTIRAKRLRLGGGWAMRGGERISVTRRRVPGRGGRDGRSGAVPRDQAREEERT